MTQKGLLRLAAGYVTDMSLTLCRTRRTRRSASHPHAASQEPELLLCGCTVDELCVSCALPTEGPLRALVHA